MSGLNRDNVLMWGILENIATLICACVCAYFISPWCFLILLNLNTIKKQQ